MVMILPCQAILHSYIAWVWWIIIPLLAQTTNTFFLFNYFERTIKQWDAPKQIRKTWQILDRQIAIVLWMPWFPCSSLEMWLHFQMFRWRIFFYQGLFQGSGCNFLDGWLSSYQTDPILLKLAHALGTFFFPPVLWILRGLTSNF